MVTKYKYQGQPRGFCNILDILRKGIQTISGDCEYMFVMAYVRVFNQKNLKPINKFLWEISEARFEKIENNILQTHINKYLWDSNEEVIPLSNTKLWLDYLFYDSKTLYSPPFG